MRVLVSAHQRCAFLQTLRATCIGCTDFSSRLKRPKSAASQWSASIRIKDPGQSTGVEKGVVRVLVSANQPLAMSPLALVNSAPLSHACKWPMPDLKVSSPS